MSKLTENDTQFKEYMGGFFHDFLKAAGITMIPGNANERLRGVGERMAAAIEHASERKAVQVIKKLQSAVTDAFVKLEEELSEVKTRLNKHNAVLSKLVQERNQTNELLEALIEDVEGLRREKDQELTNEFLEEGE